ncbi:hypothetical protein CPC08DRAFT_643214, partial [Agrocybe pediades]
RYCAIPMFGHDTIQKFTKNVSGMKKLAARDFEDMLQCTIPCFEGLLDDEDNEIILNLLFELITWNTLAKLGVHTESTVSDLEGSITCLGTTLCRFECITCSKYVTDKLPSEETAHKGAVAKGKGKEKGKGKDGPQIRKLNLSTVKLHVLGDYPHYIRCVVSTDNHSTWTVSCTMILLEFLLI